MKKKHLLGFCIFFSICLHALFLFMLQRHSIWLPASALGFSRPLPKSQILKESFERLTKHEELYFVQKIDQTIALPTKETETNIAEKTTEIPWEAHANELLASKNAPTLKPQSKPTMTLDLSKFIVPTMSAPIVTPHFSYPRKLPEPPMILSQTSPPPIQSIQPPLIAYASSSNEMELTDRGTSRRALLTIPTPPLPAFPTLDDLETSNYSDSFDVDLVCLPKNEQKGFLFALTLIPRSDLHLPKLHQHYTFLIDRANSIQKERLLATNNAVLKVIEDLPPDDTFNIVVFDNKVEKLFSSPRPADKASIAQAESFLASVNLGSFFAPADLYHPLVLTLPDHVDDDAMDTAILLTDGENFSKKSAMRSILQTWTWQNSGRVALFTIGLNGDPHLSTLDVASAFNKGKLYYSPTKRGIKRKLLKLMKNIETPIAKNIACHGIGKTQNKIDLFPRPNASPHLYLNQPFVIIGSSEKMEDFVLFIQGKLKDRWMNIKKTISFVNAKRGGHSLKQEWALQQAYQCYEQYVRDDNQEHLADARALLQPLDLETAFQ